MNVLSIQNYSWIRGVIFRSSEGDEKIGQRLRSIRQRAKSLRQRPTGQLRTLDVGEST